MHRIASFETVSRERFIQDLTDCLPVSRQEAEEAYARLRLPRRATAGSAGYDFYLPVTVTIAPGQSVKLPTGIRVRMDQDWVLALFPRSGLGFKYRLQLNNTVGIIDSDYYGSDNEGHILAKVTNDSREGKTLSLNAGDGFLQGIFLPYGVTVEDAAEGVRNGGFGSTDPA